MKRIVQRMILIFVLLLIFPITVRAVEEWPEDLYLQQNSGNTCTLCASTMMIRAWFYQNGNDQWQSITEESVRACAWSTAGLKWAWTYTLGTDEVEIAHVSVGGITAEDLELLLTEHPEGVMLYCGNSGHHGVYLTDMEDGTFYCADPAMGFAGERIPLADSLLGSRLGGQSNILEHVTAYWYIVSSQRQITEPVFAGEMIAPPIMRRVMAEERLRS